MAKVVIGGFSFDWDHGKNEQNQLRHGLSFEIAVTIWSQPARVLDIHDKRFDHREERWIALGALPGDGRIVVTVAYTDREDDIRIISARFATKAEEKFFEPDSIRKTS
jgi:uncharacterized protein